MATTTHATPVSANAAPGTAGVRDQPYHALHLLQVALWLVLAGWTAELIAMLLRKYVAHTMRLVYPAATLLGPVSYLVLLGVTVLGLLGLRRLLGQRSSPRVEIAVLTTLTAVAVIAVFAGTLGPIPWLLLSVGIGVQGMRLIIAKPARFQRIMRVTAVPLLAFMIAAGPGWYGWYWLKERTSLTRLPAASPRAPNIVFIILDTVRSVNMSLYGYTRPTTPFLEKWAQRGVRFDRAIATASWTVPSHASMFSGLLPPELQTEYNRPIKVGTQKLLADALRAQGYHTAGFVSNVFYLSREFKLDRGFTHYEDFNISGAQFILSSSLLRHLSNSNWLRTRLGFEGVLGFKSAGDLNRDFTQWLGLRNKSRPFFAFLNYYDAHEPYLPPEPFRARFAQPGPLPTYWYDGHRGERHRMFDLSQSEIAAQTGLYDGTIAYLDHALEELLTSLKRLRVLDNTIVIITSDHGEEFGEHGPMGHARTVYLPAIQVPLLLVYPGHVPAGAVVKDPVSLRDMPATVLELAGLSGRGQFPGSSLSRYWREPKADEFELVFSAILARGKPRSLIADNYHYIRREKFEELYDIDRDPLEKSNLATLATSQSLLNEFSRRMSAVPKLVLPPLPRSRSDTTTRAPR